MCIVFLFFLSVQKHLVHFKYLWQGIPSLRDGSYAGAHVNDVLKVNDVGIVINDNNVLISLPQLQELIKAKEWLNTILSENINNVFIVYIADSQNIILKVF